MEISNGFTISSSEKYTAFYCYLDKILNLFEENSLHAIFYSSSKI